MRGFNIGRNICVVTCSIVLVFFCLSDKARAGTAALNEEMKQYFFVLRIKGEHRDQDSATVSQIHKNHLANIDRLYNEGLIDIAGPFRDDTDWRGLFIFNVATEQEVRNLLKTDSAISSGRLGYIILPWYGAKGSLRR